RLGGLDPLRPVLEHRGRHVATASAAAHPLVACRISPWHHLPSAPRQADGLSPQLDAEGTAPAIRPIHRCQPPCVLRVLRSVFTSVSGRATPTRNGVPL